MKKIELPAPVHPVVLELQLLRVQVALMKMGLGGLDYRHEGHELLKGILQAQWKRKQASGPIDLKALQQSLAR